MTRTSLADFTVAAVLASALTPMLAWLLVGRIQRDDCMAGMGSNSRMQLELSMTPPGYACVYPQAADGVHTIAPSWWPTIIVIATLAAIWTT